MICARAAKRLRLCPRGERAGTAGERCEDGADDHPPERQTRSLCWGSWRRKHSLPRRSRIKNRGVRSGYTYSYRVILDSKYKRQKTFAISSSRDDRRTRRAAAGASGATAEWRRRREPARTAPMITPRKTGSKLTSLWGDRAGTVSPRRRRRSNFAEAVAENHRVARCAMPFN
jgi:hypothetical protein